MISHILVEVDLSHLGGGWIQLLAWFTGRCLDQTTPINESTWSKHVSYTHGYLMGYLTYAKEAKIQGMEQGSGERSGPRTWGKVVEDM